MNKGSSLEIVEYLFLAGSLAGTIAAITTHQVAYAAVPITLALLLNAINRYRYQHYERRSVAKMHQSVQSLQQQIQTLDSKPTDSSSVVKALQQLEQETLTLGERFNARPEMQAIAQLTNQLEDLTLQLSSLRHSPKQTDLSGIEAEIATIKADLQAVDPSAVKQLEQETLTLSEQFNARPEMQAITQLANQLDNLALRLDNLPHTVTGEPSGIEAEIANLQAHIQAIELNSSSSSIAQIHTELQEQINQLNAQIQELSQPFATSASNQRLTELEENYTTYRDDVIRLVPAVQNLQSEQATTNAVIAALSSADAELTNHLQTLASRFDSSPIEATTVDLSEIQAAIANLDLRLGELSEQFAARPELTAIQHLEELVETKISPLTVQLDALSQQFNTSNESQAIEDLQSTTANLNLQLSELSEQLAARTELTAIQNLEGLVETQIAHLTLQLDALSQQFNTRTEVQAIGHLEETIAQLQQSLEVLATSSIAVDAPSEVEASMTKDEAVAEFATKQELETLTQSLTLAIEELSMAIAQLPEVARLREELPQDDAVPLNDSLSTTALLDLDDLFTEQIDTSVEPSHSSATITPSAELDLEDLFADMDMSVQPSNPSSIPPSAELDLEDLFADRTDALLEPSHPDAAIPPGTVLNLEDLFGDQVDLSVEQLNEAIASLPPGSDLDLEELLLALTPKPDAPKSSKDD